MPTIRSSCSSAYIVAHEEVVDALQAALLASGFDVETVRGPYTLEQLGYSRQVKCLVNHANVWRLVAAGSSPALVVEADFVPVKGMADLPLPFPYSGDARERKFGWLYSGGSILYGFDEQGFPHGHGNATVAYALTPGAANRLLEFFELEIASDATGAYRNFESRIGVHMRRKQGILNYIPIYQYGEHGGRENPEHRVAGIRGWHQADILWRSLAFLPAYANGNGLLYRLVRIRAWLRGLLRVATLRYFDPRYVNADSSLGRLTMAGLAISRIFHLAQPYIRRLRTDGLNRDPSGVP